MWLIVSVFAAVFTAFAKPEAGASPLVPFQFYDLKVLTDLFVDCDTIIVSDGGIPHNIHQVSQPVKVYNKWLEFKELTSHSYMYTPSYGISQQKQYQYYQEKKVQLLRKELKGLNCRAQILIFYSSRMLNLAGITLEDLSGFRHDESAYRYTVILHRANYKLKREMFKWTWVKPTASTVPLFYHVTMECYYGSESLIHKPRSAVSSPIAVHSRDWTTCFIMTFKKVCTCCKIHSVLSYRCGPLTRCPLRISQQGKTLGSIKANERHLTMTRRKQFVQVYGLKLAYGLQERYDGRSGRWTYYRDFILALQQEFGQHAVVTMSNVVIFPEEIFLNSILSHHGNVTMKMGKHETPIFAGEVIFGPGHSRAEGMGGTMHTAPVGLAGVSFMTCSNISFIPISGIFYAPFDLATWMWTLTSVAAVSVAMLMTMKKTKMWPALFLTLYTMVRLLLDNQNRVRKDLVRRGEVMASLTFLMALVATILCTGYRGVLTSDLAKLPEVVTPPSFEHVLSSDWTLFRHSSLSFPKTLQVSLRAQSLLKLKLDLDLKLWKQNTHFNQKYHDFQYVGRGLEEYQLVSKALDKLAVDMHQLENAPDVMSGVEGPCQCNGSYWLFETGTFWQPRFPNECKDLSAHQIFLLSEERIAKSIISWSTFTMRPGPVFRSIHRGIEAGLYKWLYKVRSISRSGVYVQDHVMSRILKKEPKPLSMKTVLVSSTLWLYFLLSLITIAVLVCEFLWINKKRMYFIVRGWITKCKRRWKWQALCRCRFLRRRL